MTCQTAQDTRWEAGIKDLEREMVREFSFILLLFNLFLTVRGYYLFKICTNEKKINITF